MPITSYLLYSPGILIPEVYPGTVEGLLNGMMDFWDYEWNFMFHHNWNEYKLIKRTKYLLNNFQTQIEEETILQLKEFPKV